MILIFDSELGGHHLEYIHHLWLGIINNSSEKHYTIAVPQKDWNKLKHLLHWPETNMITLRLLTEKELSYKSRLPIFKRSEKESSLITMLVKEIGDVERIILPNLAVTLPLLPVYLPSNIKISGIIYSVPYYVNFHGLKSIKDNLLYRLLAKDSRFDNVYLLNSKSAVKYYNKKLNTDHFKFLVDPIPDIDQKNLLNLRQQYNIHTEDTVFLHFGVMAYRKGTIELMKAILQLANFKDRVFVFAGTITNEILEPFEKLRDEIEKKGIRIIVQSGFLEFKDILNWCNTSDCILVPYLDSACSSGVIGYGALLRKPIIGTKEGLIGELIRDNGLGITTAVSDQLLSESIENFKPYQTNSEYVLSNTLDNFQKTLLNEG